MNNHFEWTGDLDDDCVCRWSGYLAHCECMHDRPYEHWYVGVYRDTGKPGAETIYHSHEADTIPRKLCGKTARAIAEQVMMMQARIDGRCE